MAYLDRHSDPRRRNLAVAGVVMVHAVVGYALVTGLGAAIGNVFDPPPLIGVQIPLPPPPPPPDKDVEKAEQKAASSEVAPLPPQPLPTDNTRVVEKFDPLVPSIDEVIARPLPPEPIELKPSGFPPRAASPSNDPGGWVLDSDYPSIAINGELEGIARFELKVGADGRVAECRITRSTGHRTLDDATCRRLKQRARFSAATDGNGAKVAGTYASQIVWRLPD